MCLQMQMLYCSTATHGLMLHIFSPCHQNGLSDYARTHNQRSGLKIVHSVKDSELPEPATAPNRLARGAYVARKLGIREAPLILIL
jgi:hypothetical protein